MGGLTRWGFDGGKEVYCVQYWPWVAAVDGGGECAIDCWGALTREGGRREGENDLHWGKGALEGGGLAALA